MKKIGLMKSKAFVIYTKKDLIKSITKVRDHCYCTGKYRRAAHDICNPRHKTSNRIPVVFPCNQWAIKINWGSICMLRRKFREIYYFFSTN